MEKIDLKEHIELFQILPQKDYSQLEKALEKELYLTPQSIEGPGRSLLGNEKLAKGLPSMYEGIKKLQAMEEKQRQVQNGEKGFHEYFDIGKYKPATIIGSSELIGTAVNFGLFSYIGSIAGPFDVGNTLAMVWGGITIVETVWVFSAGLCAMSGTEADPPDPSEFFGPVTLLAITPTYIKHRKQRNKYMHKKIEKQRTGLSNKILKVTESTLGYTEKWQKKQQKELLKTLDNDETQDVEFINAYNEIEKRLVPLHKLELQKRIEKHVYKEWRWRRSVEQTAKKLERAKKAGLILGSVEEGLKQEISKKRKELKKQDNKLKNILEKI